MTALFDRPERTLDAMGPVHDGWPLHVSLAGADAHARLGLRDYEDDGVDPPALPLPALRVRLPFLLDHRPARHAPAGRSRLQDADRLVQAMAAGRSYTSIDGVAAPARFEFFARTPTGVRDAGGVVAVEDQRVTFVARALGPRGTRIRLFAERRVRWPSRPAWNWSTRFRLRCWNGERGAGYRVEATAPEVPARRPCPGSSRTRSSSVVSAPRAGGRVTGAEPQPRAGTRSATRQRTRPGSRHGRDRSPGPVHRKRLDVHVRGPGERGR